MVNSRQKGKRGELELVHWLKDKGIMARRGQQFKGTPDSPDIECEYLRKFHIEVKRVERLNLYEALEQAENDKDKNEVATVWHKKNRKEWVVILDADEFIKLLNPQNLQIIEEE